jgi:HK97 family phage prohead protease
MDNFYNHNVNRSMLQQSAKTLQFEIKSLNEDGTFAGYASVFNVLDSQRDIIKVGAFSQTIKGRISEIKLLWQHNMSEPIGTIEELKEDSQGLYIRAKLLLGEIARANEAYALIKAGVVKGLSIGYSPVRYRYDTPNRIRYISQVDLWEVSLVTYPANPKAQITVLKSDHLKQNHNQDNVALLGAINRAITILSNNKLNNF